MSSRASNAEGPAPRKRSRIACTECNARKIRCDVTRTGTPCTNCAEDKTTRCEVISKRKRRTTQSQGAERTASVERDRALAEGPLYIGDHHAGAPNVYELPNALPPSGSSIAQVPSGSHLQSPLAGGDGSDMPVRLEPLDLLVSQDLLQCYLQHVHFFLPVLEATTLTQCKEEQLRCGLLGGSPLLYWALMLAAANYVQGDTLVRSGFATRKLLRTTLHGRCKKLFDNDKGTDRIILIQATTLMGFWYSDPEDYTGAWYWIGVAISLAQQAGLHRDASPNTFSNIRGLRRSPSSLRRIWWCLVVRDRWLSLAKGLPMRIYEGDCDVPCPTPDDILADMRFMDVEGMARLGSIDFEKLSFIFPAFARASDCLGQILRAHYGPTAERQPLIGAGLIAKHGEDLRSCIPASQTWVGASRETRVQFCYLELYCQAIGAVLYRPYVLNDVPDLAHHIREQALENAHRAAAQTNMVLEKLIDLDAIQLLKPMAITAIIPTMQIHLADCHSSVLARRILGKHKLDLCMLVLSLVRDTYWSAGVMHDLFARAMETLPPADVPTITAQPVVSNPPAMAVQSVPIEQGILSNSMIFGGTTAASVPAPAPIRREDGAWDATIPDLQAMQQSWTPPPITSDASIVNTLSLEQLLDPRFTLFDIPFNMLAPDGTIDPSALG